eukprot:TRINITY_DN574_c0_g1_i1.p1 TRINITY_DN574_c0_g1~~TRINITY_DN574_c0_g1_i1.p1  ORF type:complete len:258 (-),score=45.45 TRINITY_DN574_c0_g1_i1:615-1331(-)
MASIASLKRWWVFKTHAHKHLTKKEFAQIKLLFRASRTGTFVNRVVTKDAFVNYFSNSDVPNPLPPSLSRALFRAIVRDGEDSLTYNDLVHALGICANGTEREQLQFLYCMYVSDLGVEEEDGEPIEPNFLCPRQLANMLTDADLVAHPVDSRMARRFFAEEMRTAFRGRDVMTSDEFAAWVQEYSRGMRIIFDAVCDVAFPGRDKVQAQFSGEVYDAEHSGFGEHQGSEDEMSEYEL